MKTFNEKAFIIKMKLFAGISDSSGECPEPISSSKNASVWNS